MNVGLSGKRALIIITVIATSGGFALGYFVGRNVPAMPTVQSVVQTVPPSPAVPNSGTAAGEPKPSEGASPSSEQTSKREESLPVVATVQAQETKKNVAPEEAANNPKPAAARHNGNEKEGSTEAAGAEKETGEQKVRSGAVYAIQVGAFRSRKEADALKADLEHKGFRARSQKVVTKGKALFKVIVGEFGQRKEAEVLALKLEKVEGLKAFVTVKK